MITFKFRLYILFVLAILPLIVSCTSTIIYLPKYSRETNNFKRLSVIFINDKIKIDYTGSLNNEFGENNIHDSIRSFLQNQIIQNLGKFTSFKIVSIDTSDFMIKKELFRYKVFIEDSSNNGRNGVMCDSVLFVIPDGHRKICDSSDLSLILQEFKIKSKINVSIHAIGSSPAVMLPVKPLDIQSKFIYWDNINNSPVAYGIAYGTNHPPGAEVTKKSWKQSIKAYSCDLLWGTPFKNSAFDSLKNEEIR